MDDKYLKQLYDYLKVSEKGISFDSFKLAVSTDEATNDSIFDAMAKVNSTYREEGKREKFRNMTGFTALSDTARYIYGDVKKKEDVSDSASPQEEDPAAMAGSSEAPQTAGGESVLNLDPSVSYSDAASADNLWGQKLEGDLFDFSKNAADLAKEAERKKKQEEEDRAAKKEQLKADLGFDINEKKEEIKAKHKDLLDKYLTDSERVKQLESNIRSASIEAQATVGQYEDLLSGDEDGPYAQAMRNRVFAETQMAEEGTRENDKRKQFVDEAYVLARKELGEYITENIVPEDKKDDDEYLMKLTDLIMDEVGIDADLDKNGRYHEQLLVSDWVLGIGAASINLAKGVASLVGSPVSEAEDTFSYLSEAEENLRSKMTQYSIGSIVDETGESAGYNTFRKISTGFFETLPIMAVTAGVGYVTGGAGVSPMLAASAGSATVGALVGTTTAMESYYSGKYRTDDSTGLLESIGEGLVSGGGEAAFAYVGGKIFVNAGKATTLGMSKTALKGYAKGMGMSFAEESLTEGATELSNILYELRVGKEGSAPSVSEAIARVGDAMIIGGFAGSGFSAVGSGYANYKYNRAKSEFLAVNSIIQGLESEEIATLSASEASLSEQIKKETNPERRNALTAQYAEVLKKKHEARLKLVPFYQMIKYRHPEAMQRISAIDSEVAVLAKQYEQLSKGEKITDTAEGQEAPTSTAHIKKRMEALVEERRSIMNQYSGESVELTAQEQIQRSEDYLRSGFADLDSEIEAAKAEAEDARSALEDGSGTEDAVLAAENRLQEVTERRRNARKLLGEAEAIRREWADAVNSNKSQERIDALKDMVIEAVGVAASALDMEPEAVVGAYRSGNQDAASLQQSAEEKAARESDTWVRESLESQDPTSLTRESLEAILTSDNYAILTGENPNNAALNEAENAKRRQAAIEWLTSRGLTFHEVKGRYDGKGENSLIVEGMTTEQAKEFARDMGQHSVVTPAGLIKPNGQFVSLGDVQYNEAVNDGDNFFTAVKLADGTTIGIARDVGSDYVDGNGNPIEEDTFWDSDTEQKPNETVISDILEADPEERSTDNVFEPNSDGTFNFNTQNTGMNPEEVKAMNQVFGSLGSVMGDGFSVVVSNDANAEEFGSYDPKTNTITINPRSLSKWASEGGSGLDLTENLRQVVLEEFSHAMNTMAIINSSRDNVLTFVRGFFRNIKVTKAVELRVHGKVRAYIDQALSAEFGQMPYRSDFDTELEYQEAMSGYTQKIFAATKDQTLVDLINASEVGFVNNLVNDLLPKLGDRGIFNLIADEVTADMSAFVGENKVSLTGGFVQSVVDFFRRKKIARGRVDANMIRNENDVRSYLLGMQNASRGERSFVDKLRLSDKAMESNPSLAEDSRRSQRLRKPESPAKLPDGPFKMTFIVPAIRNNEWSQGEGYVKEMNFNDKWHFVNWWRRETNEGKKPYGGFVAEFDGKEMRVNPDVIKNWKMKPLPPIRSATEELARMRRAVAEYVSSLDKLGPEHTKFLNKEGRERTARSSSFPLASAIETEIAKRVTGQEVNFSSMYLLPDVENALRKANPRRIASVTDQVISELKGETPTESVIRKSGGVRSTTMLREEAAEMRDSLRDKARTKLGIRKGTATELELQSAVIARHSGINKLRNPENRRKAIAKEGYLDVKMTMDIAKEAGIDIRNIFKHTKRASQDFLGRLANDVGDKRITSFEPIFHMISAITSNGIELAPNIEVTKLLFREAMNNYFNKGVAMFTEESLNAFIVKTGINLRGPRANYMKAQLLSLSKALDKGPISEFVKDGVLDSKALVEWLSSPIMGRSDGTTIRNIHSIMSQAGSLKSSTTVKLPNYALSLMGAEGEYAIPDLNVIDQYNVLSGALERKSKMFSKSEEASTNRLFYKLFPNAGDSVRTITKLKMLLDAKVFFELPETNSDKRSSQDVSQEDINNHIHRLFMAEAGRKLNVAETKGVHAMLVDVRDMLNTELESGQEPYTLQDVSQLFWFSARASKVGDLKFEHITMMPELINDTSTDVPGGKIDIDAKTREIVSDQLEYADSDSPLKTKLGVALNEALSSNIETIEARESVLFQKREAPPTGRQTMSQTASLVLDPAVASKLRNFEAITDEERQAMGNGDTEAAKRMPLDGLELKPDPFNSGMFVDANGNPISNATAVVFYNGKAYASGRITYAKPELKDTGEYIENPPAKELEKLDAYMENVLGHAVEGRDALVEAYNMLPAESKEALRTSEVAENVVRQSRRVRINGRLRQTASRSANQYSTVRNEIVNNPENYISKQKLGLIKEQLKFMSEEDLVSVMTDDGLGRLSNRNDDVGVLAGAEIIRRKIADGDLDAIPPLIEELSKIGTTAGRILRHFRELKGATPKGLTDIIEKMVEKRGNRLTDSQKVELDTYAKRLFELQVKQRKLMERAIRGEDVEAELNEVNKQLKEAERNMDTFANKYIEKGWGQIGQMLIQGNLLTPMSQFTNVGANLVNALVKVPVDLLALPLQKLASKFGFTEGTDRQASISAYMYGVRKFGTGFMEAIDQIITGQESNDTEWRVNRGFAPFRSIVAAYRGGEALPLGPDGKASASQRAKLFVQGTLGVPAEIMFRFLSLGDTPFRRMVEGYELYQAGLNMGLEGEALKKFLKYPTRAEMEAAAVEGRKLTFQEETVASKAAEDAVAFAERLFSKAFDWIPGVDGMAFGKFFVRSNIPYVRTPANILYDTLTFVTPYIAVPRMLAELSNGNSREASRTLAKLIAGTTITQVGAMMIKEGLLSGAIDWEEDEEKNMAYDQFPPNSINVSGLQRWIKGESTAKQNDDYFIGYNKLGIIGAILGATAKSTRKDELGDIDPFSVNKMLRDAFGINAFSSISYMMDQSFLQGMTNLIDVFSASDIDDLESTSERWLGSMFQAVSATVLPNTLSAINRMNREYMPDFRVTDDMTWEQRVLKKFEYTLRDRTFNTDGIPVRVNWKGQPIRQTPRGTSGFAYNMFDITKSRQGEDDLVSNEVWRLYENTEELPSAVGTPYYAQKRKISVPSMSMRTKKEREAFTKLGKDYEFLKDEEFVDGSVALNTEQINKLMEISGRQRYSELEALIASEGYMSMTDKEKIEAMNEIDEDYRSLKEYDGDSFKPHTIQALDFIEEQYLKLRGRE